MADLAITATEVLKSTGASLGEGYLGEACVAGDSVYIDTAASNVLKKADANDTAAKAVVAGVLLNGGAAGQPAKYQKGGDIIVGAAAAPAVGTLYVQSATAGKICPIADLIATNFVTVIGIGKTATTIAMLLNPSGIQKA